MISEGEDLDLGLGTRLDYSRFLQILLKYEKGKRMPLTYTSDVCSTY